ncbi:MAG: hypothetical protein M9955_15725 [Rhizobiaceae bacterium]|nr:hypothetical protein [Rhizobiaceae bacterium]
MPGATTDFVGVRVFSNLSGTLARIDTRDSTVIGLTGPMPLADAGIFPLNTRVRFATDDAAKVLAMGACLLQDAIKQIGSEGIVTTVQVVRTQHSSLVDANAKLAAEMSAIVGSAALHTGVWAHANGDPAEGAYPGLLLAPGNTTLRPTTGVAGITLADGGEDYTEAPSVEIVGGGGAGASAICSINEAGQVEAIAISNPGIGYQNAAAKATGEITFVSNPVADTTVTIAGTAVTFKGSGAAGNQVNIGVDLAATLTALAVMLNGSADANLVTVDYVATPTRLQLTAATAGAAGNAIAFSTTVAGATVSGPALAGGYDAPSVVFSGGGGSGAVATLTLGTVRNPVMVAMDAVCTRLIDCKAIGDTPTTSVAAAREWAADFATSYNVIAMYPAAIVNLGAGNVTRPLSPHVAAATVRRDKEAGNPYKAAWNRPLQGILGTSKPVGYTDGDISSEANVLVQGGVGTVIEGNLLWAPFTTATDPTTIGYRSIKVIRTRHAADKAMLRPMRKYMSSDMTPHEATQVFLSGDAFYSDLKALGAIIEYEWLWSPTMNPGALLQAGAMRVKVRYAETPDLVDLQIYSETMPEAYDALAAAIATAINALGRPNIRVAA